MVSDGSTNGFGIDGGLRRALEDVLETGEKILWAERPVAGFFSTETVGRLSGGVFWILCLVAMMVFSRLQGARWTDVAPVLLFMPFGLLLMHAPVARYRRMRRTIYAITERRALTVLNHRKCHVKSYPMKEIRQVRLRERDNGTGDVTIVCGVRFEGLDDAEKDGFYHIRRPAGIARLLESLMAGGTGEHNAACTDQDGRDEENGPHPERPVVVRDSSSRSRTARMVAVAVVLLIFFGFFPMLQATHGIVDRLTGTGWPGFFVLLFLLVVLLQLRTVFHAGSSANWPTTRGVVEESYVLKTDDAERGIFYRPRIRYRYRVDGEQYLGDQITLRQRSEALSRDSAERIIARYPEGCPVTVYHHPRRPGHSVLEPGRGMGNWIVLAFLLACLIAAAIWLGVDQKLFSISVPGR